MNSPRRLIALAALLVFASPIHAAERLPLVTTFKGRERFEWLVKSLRPKVEELRALTIGERLGWFGRVFSGTPYKSFTLEIDDHIESPSVNLNGLDCWTFFETALAFSRLIETPPEKWTPDALLDLIEADRYWGGTCDGTYLSRLHYLEDWLHDNAKRGLIRDLTRSLGGRGVQNSAIEMTNAWRGYRYMRSNPDLRVGIAKLESRLRNEPLYCIPKDRVPGIESQLQTGDIIGIISYDGSAYGTSHVGLAYRAEDGVLHFMHASAPSNAGKVILDVRLSDYLAKFSKHYGILVGRPVK